MIISIKTTIFQNHSKEIIESTATGRFYQKENAYFLQYQEETTEGEIRTVVKLAEEEALILRNGAVKMRLPFKLHQEMMGSYELPFGTFEIASLAKKIQYSYNHENSKGYIELLYDFSMQGSPAGTYQLEITFQEDNNEYR